MSSTSRYKTALPGSTSSTLAFMCLDNVTASSKYETSCSSCSRFSSPTPSLLMTTPLRWFADLLLIISFRPPSTPLVRVSVPEHKKSHRARGNGVFPLFGVHVEGVEATFRGFFGTCDAAADGELVAEVDHAGEASLKFFYVTMLQIGRE